MFDTAALLHAHRAAHPAMQAEDVVKLIFQSQLGCGHMIPSAEAAAQRITDEEASLLPRAAEPLTEDIGGDYLRLNLRPAMAQGILPKWIAAMMVETCRRHPQLPNRQAVRTMIASLSAEAAGVPQSALHAAAALLDTPDALPSHSSTYRAAEAPAYRVIDRCYSDVLPMLAALAAQAGKSRVLMALDGPSGSGKSTLSALLSGIVDAAVIPMDDFFLPHAEKTPERLAQPGGNVAIERFVSEVLTPYLSGHSVVYRPYDCHADGYRDAITVPQRRVTLVEGVYALHPATHRPYDVSCFLTIDPAQQRERILARNGEAMLHRFVDTWIPLEQAYFTANGLPDGRCVVIPRS